MYDNLICLFFWVCSQVQMVQWIITNLTEISDLLLTSYRRVRESNPGHIGGRRALSPLRHPCAIPAPRLTLSSFYSFPIKAAFAPTEVRKLAQVCASELSREVTKAQIGNRTPLNNIDGDREGLENYGLSVGRWL